MVVDHLSSDSTADIARARGARVLPADGVLSELRRLGCEAATGRWILSLDADERLPADGLGPIYSAVENDALDGYRLPILTLVGDRPLRWGGYWPADRLRLFRRGTARWPLARVHERPLVRGAVGRLNVVIEHPGFRDLDHVREKQRRYAAWAALDLRAAHGRPSLFTGVVHASWRVARSYCFRGGFLMGRLGWSMAWIQAEYVWKRTRWAREGPPPELAGPR